MDNSPATQGFFHLPAFPPVLAIPSSHSDDDASSLGDTLATSSSDCPVAVGTFREKKTVTVFPRVLEDLKWYRGVQ